MLGGNCLRIVMSKVMKNRNKKKLKTMRLLCCPDLIGTPRNDMRVLIVTIPIGVIYLLPSGHECPGPRQTNYRYR